MTREEWLKCERDVIAFKLKNARDSGYSQIYINALASSLRYQDEQLAWPVSSRIEVYRRPWTWRFKYWLKERTGK